MPGGTEIYNLANVQIAARGLIYTDTELNVAIAGPVSAIAFDDEGTDALESLLSSAAETDFESKELRRIISSKREPESWRVGEALAESYLTAHKNCTFPWPNSRDQKMESSSLPGTDLVGFQATATEDNRFSFGEVKTSDEEKYPPSVMYGRHGLKQQLEDLCDNVDTRNSLVKYLGHRTQGSAWEPQFRDAAKRYMENNTDVSIFGVMVRDVKPHEDDLRARAEKLGKSCPAAMSIELLAIYLPIASIGTLGSKLTAIRKEGDE
jgi:hypothetical protein